MNIIKKVIVIVMGIVVIGVLATNVNIISQSKTVYKTVTFEIIDASTVTSGTYNLVNKYAIIDKDDDIPVVNLINAYHNGTLIDSAVMYYIIDSNSYSLYGNDDYFDDLSTDDTIVMYTPPVVVGDTFTLTFEVEQQTPLVVKTLLALAPLILTAGVLMIIYKGVGNKE